MTYACSVWEFAAGNHLVQLQRLQNKVFRTIGNFPRRTPVRDLHVDFRLPYIHDYITKLCRQRALVIQNNENATLDKANLDTGSIRGLNMATVKHTTVLVTSLLL
jgi:hypothetical protein